MGPEPLKRRLGWIFYTQKLKTTKNLPQMTVEGLDAWLRVAADNKITARNAWDAPLIDHFSNTEEFRGARGINFQKATSTLDGCMKVYSTRVDAVMEDTSRLLGSLSTEDLEKGPSSLRQRKKKGCSTLEKNVSCLNLKVLRTALLAEMPLFRHKESASILSFAKISSGGMLSLREDRFEERMNLKEYPAEFAGLVTDNHICPTLNDIHSDIINETSPGGYGGATYEPAFLEVDDFAGREVENTKKPLYASEERRVSSDYIKDWAGPCHWKPPKKAQKSRSRVLTKYKIDFFKNPNKDLLHEKGNTLMSTDVVVRRRSERHVLPEDHKFKREDLYKFLVRDGVFTRKVAEEDSIREGVGEMSICCTPEEALQNADVNDVPFEEIEADAKSLENSKMSKNLFLSYRRAPKKIDIKKLQENVLKSVGRREGVSLKTICREVPAMYDRKSPSDISVHYCVLSLLFLAHTKSLEISGVGSDLSVRQGG